MKDNNNLSHSTWNCKYHLVFAPKYSVASIMEYLKGKSSLIIFDRYANLKYRYGNRHFWCVDTVGKIKKQQKIYKKQLQEDIATDQISTKEYVDPFEKDKERKIKKRIRTT